MVYGLHLNNFKVNVYLSLLVFFYERKIIEIDCGAGKGKFKNYPYDPKPIDCAHVIYYHAIYCPYLSLLHQIISHGSYIVSLNCEMD